jgi:hypothetical protein
VTSTVATKKIPLRRLASLRVDASERPTVGVPDALEDTSRSTRYSYIPFPLRALTSLELYPLLTMLPLVSRSYPDPRLRETLADVAAAGSRRFAAA